MTNKSWKQRLLFILKFNFEHKQYFTLEQVYRVSLGSLQFLYPNNNTVSSSIRHNLERLRDDGIIKFVDNNGLYSW
tara:strand:+ start:973 stop:1200 length:228 start_codon:yes stop_codon:yes gene_type:complete